jgi:hypothetical protein
MTPLILSSKEIEGWDWKFVDYRFSNIFRKQGDLLILVRKYHDGKTSNENIISELLELRKNYSKIIYFDDSASATSISFFAFPYVDQYWKRACLSDTNLYKKKFYGGHLFSDYYHSEFGVDDLDQKYFNPVIHNDVDLNKLKISWNIGIGVYPLNKDNLLDRYYKYIRKILTGMTIIPSIEPIYYLISHYFEIIKKELEKEVHFDNKIKKFSSRFVSANYRNSIGHQRNLLIKQTSNNKNYLTGHKSKREFTQETFNVFGVLSPFGWGEVCYRDFEAAIGGSYLIKPNMSHIDTWPNLYKKDMYHSLSWDLNEIDKLEYLFDQTEKCESAVNKTRREYLLSINSSVARCIKMIEEII